MNSWRVKTVLALLALPLFIAATGCGVETGPSSTQKPTQKNSSPIEERSGLWYSTGTSNLYSGVLAHQYPNGTNSVESVYTNGLRQSQRAWHTNGVLKTEFRFHQGRLAVRRSWDITGKSLTWKQDRLAAAQAQQGFDLLNKGKFVEGYVWVHIAGANGQPDAKRALEQFPPSMTGEQQAQAKAIAEKILGTSGNNEL